MVITSSGPLLLSLPTGAREVGYMARRHTRQCNGQHGTKANRASTAASCTHRGRELLPSCPRPLGNKNCKVTAV